MDNYEKVLQVILFFSQKTKKTFLPTFSNIIMYLCIYSALGEL